MYARELSAMKYQETRQYYCHRNDKKNTVETTEDADRDVRINIQLDEQKLE